MTTADTTDTTLSEWHYSVAREYLGKLLERNKQGASENDIRSAFRDFLVRTAIAADEGEIVTETRPAADSRNKVDLYIRNTYVEFKRSIIKGGVMWAMVESLLVCDYVAMLESGGLVWGAQP